MKRRNGQVEDTKKNVRNRGTWARAAVGAGRAGGKVITTCKGKVWRTATPLEPIIVIASRPYG